MPRVGCRQKVQGPGGRSIDSRPLFLFVQVNRSGAAGTAPANHFLVNFICFPWGSSRTNSLSVKVLILSVSVFSSLVLGLVWVTFRSSPETSYLPVTETSAP